eukprot:6930419-Alexandrium_andersonii.AAC.1
MGKRSPLRRAAPSSAPQPSAFADARARRGHRAGGFGGRAASESSIAKPHSSLADSGAGSGDALP